MATNFALDDRLVEEARRIGRHRTKKEASRLQGRAPERPPKVLVDTPIWSLALQYRQSELNPEEQRLTEHLTELIEDGRVVMIGPVRQELLSGIKSRVTFERLKRRLSKFPDEPLTSEDYELAAKISNTSATEGRTWSEIDLLKCAVTVRRGLAIFTTNRDLLSLCHDHSGNDEQRGIGPGAGAIVAATAHHRPRSTHRVSRRAATARRPGHSS